MAGEILKGSININAVNTQKAEIVPDNNNNHYFNELAAYDYDNDAAGIISKLTGVNDISSSTPKLAIEQGKQFQIYQVRFDAAVTSANVVNIINDRINEWITNNGKRYDDFNIVINPSGLNHDITTVIIRYF